MKLTLFKVSIQVTTVCLLRGNTLWVSMKVWTSGKVSNINNLCDLAVSRASPASCLRLDNISYT